MYWSPFTGDILVGMCMENLKKGTVIRYNQVGQLKQTIQHNDSSLELYKQPSFLTENNNGDVVVSDCHNAVLVTDCRGRHRFSYSITPSGSELVAFGVCFDALWNILVCDYRTNTVQMLNKDGQFLLHLLIRPSGLFSPHVLSYNVNTHCLWVESLANNRVYVYRYIDRQNVLIGKCYQNSVLRNVNEPDHYVYLSRFL